MVKNKKILYGLDHLGYEHPFDNKSLKILENTPGLATVGKFVTKNTIEKYCTVQYTGSFSVPQPKPKSVLNPILVILSVLLPLIGYILYLVKRDDDSKIAKTYLWCAIIGLIIGLTLMC